MHWSGGLVGGRHHHMHHVFSAQLNNATDFFLKLWYVLIGKCILKDFLATNTSTSLQNIHDYISVCWQVKG